MWRYCEKISDVIWYCESQCERNSSHIVTHIVTRLWGDCEQRWIPLMSITTHTIKITKMKIPKPNNFTISYVGRVILAMKFFLFDCPIKRIASVGMLADSASNCNRFKCYASPQNNIKLSLEWVGSYYIHYWIRECLRLCSIKL